MKQLEQQVGRPVPVAHFFVREGRVFPNTEEIALTRRGGDSSVLFLNVKPEWVTPDEVLTWRDVAEGKADAYIDEFTDQLARLEAAPFVTVHHEPEDEVDPAVGSGYSATDYAQMFRHVAKRVDARLAAQGVDPDVRPIWVWDITGYPQWEPLWDELYPGDDVVDWIAYAPYLEEPLGCDFSCVANRTYPQFPEWTGFYDWAGVNHPDTPLMLGEWGVEESSSPEGATAKADLFRSVPQVLATSFPRLKAIIYFNDSKPPTDPTASRIDTSSQSLAAFRDMVADEYLQQRTK